MIHGELKLMQMQTDRLLNSVILMKVIAVFWFTQQVDVDVVDDLQDLSSICPEQWSLIQVKCTWE